MKGVKCPLAWAFLHPLSSSKYVLKSPRPRREPGYWPCASKRPGVEFHSLFFQNWWNERKKTTFFRPSEMSSLPSPNQCFPFKVLKLCDQFCRSFVLSSFPAKRAKFAQDKIMLNDLVPLSMFRWKISMKDCISCKFVTNDRKITFALLICRVCRFYETKRNVNKPRKQLDSFQFFFSHAAKRQLPFITLIIANYVQIVPRK